MWEDVKAPSSVTVWQCQTFAFLPSKNCNPRGAGHKPNRKTTLLQASVPALPVVSCKALKNVWVLKPYGTLWRSYLILRSSRFKCAMTRPKHVLSILHVYIYIFAFGHFNIPRSFRMAKHPSFPTIRILDASSLRLSLGDNDWKTFNIRKAG